MRHLENDKIAGIAALALAVIGSAVVIFAPDSAPDAAIHEVRGAMAILYPFGAAALLRHKKKGKASAEAATDGPAE